MKLKAIKNVLVDLFIFNKIIMDKRINNRVIDQYQKRWIYVPTPMPTRLIQYEDELFFEIKMIESLNKIPILLLYV